MITRETNVHFPIDNVETIVYTMLTNKYFV